MKDKKRAPAKRVLLRFRKGTDDIETVRGELSSCVRCDNNLFLAHDESAAVERLTWRKDKYKHHRTFELQEFLDLPDDSEMDIEGLAWQAPYLWVCGSMSLKRDFPDPDDTPEEAAALLATLRVDPNRFTLARIPCVYNNKKGTWTPSKKVRNPDKTAAQKYLRPTLLERNRESNVLTELLATDRHLGPFLSIPCKDNGLDVEGIAVHGEHLYLGLRGPVLHGWAVVLDVQVEEHDGVLRLRSRGDRAKPYNKHFIKLAGMGIRELSARADNGDLHLLAGPTMDLDGTISTWRIAGGLADKEITVTHDPERLFDLIQAPGTPYGLDQAEGIALTEEGDYLIVYDSPIEERFEGKRGYWADVYARVPPKT